MISFVAGRTLRMLVTVFVVFTLAFFASRYSGSVIDSMFQYGCDAECRQGMLAYLDLNGSYLEQYGRFWSKVLDGNFGDSLYERRPVTEIYGERIGNTLKLFLAAYVFSIVVGVPLGILSAVRRGSGTSTAIMTVAFLGYATPNFILSIFFVLLFSFTLHWLPSAGNDTWVHFIMPVMALGLFMMASTLRFTRSAMLEVLSADFVRTARAKGLSDFVVVGKHALRNAAIPIVSILGLQAAGFIGAVVLVESVFALRGIGDLVVRAAILRDYTLLQFGVIVWAGVATGVAFVVDVVYGMLDPRIRVVGQ